SPSGHRPVLRVCGTGSTPAKGGGRGRAGAGIERPADIAVGRTPIRSTHVRRGQPELRRVSDVGAVRPTPCRAGTPSPLGDPGIPEATLVGDSCCIHDSCRVDLPLPEVLGVPRVIAGNDRTE